MFSYKCSQETSTFACRLLQENGNKSTCIKYVPLFIYTLFPAIVYQFKGGGSPSSHLKDFLQLSVVLHHNDISFAVFCYVLAGLRRVGGVDAHRKPTERDEGGSKLDCSVFTDTVTQMRLSSRVTLTEI